MNNDYLEGMTTVQQRNVTSIYEPQNPLYHKEKDAYFYPLTSEKQIVMDDGRRLNAVLEEDFAKKDEVNSAKAEAIDSSKVYTNEQIKKAAHRNLLDNSDFRNPVNQRGGNNLDRWTFVNVAFSGNTLLSFQSDGIVITNDAGADRVCLYQKFIEKNFDGKTYAAYIMTSDGLYSGYVETIKEDEGIRQCNFWIPTGSKIIWAALYEGEYTIDTLPEYQPKGYGAELAECQRYYLPILNEWVNGTTFEGEGFNIRIVAPAEMRSINVTVENSSIEVYKGGVWHETSIQWTVHRGGGMYDIVCAIPEALATGTSYIARGLIALNAEL